MNLVHHLIKPGSDLKIKALVHLFLSLAGWDVIETKGTGSLRAAAKRGTKQGAQGVCSLARCAH